jgi:hypothetical protein
MWIIQLSPPGSHIGPRYYSARGHHIVIDSSKAKIFISKKEAQEICDRCTLWKNRKLIPVKSL